MSNLLHNDITKEGVALIAKAMEGKKVEFTKLTVGDGYMPAGVTPNEMTDVVNRLIDIPVNQLKPQTGNAFLVGGSFSNTDLNVGFFYRELGLYANDPDKGEILYAYGNAADQADFISPAADGTLTEKMVSLIVYVGPGVEVTITMGTTAYASQEDFDALELRVDATEENLYPPSWQYVISDDAWDEKGVCTITNALLADQNVPMEILSANEMDIYPEPDEDSTADQQKAYDDACPWPEAQKVNELKIRYFGTEPTDDLYCRLVFSRKYKK